MAIFPSLLVIYSVLGTMIYGEHITKLYYIRQHSIFENISLLKKLNFNQWAMMDSEVNIILNLKKKRF